MTKKLFKREKEKQQRKNILLQVKGLHWDKIFKSQFSVIVQQIVSLFLFFFLFSFRDVSDVSFVHRVEHLSFRIPSSAVVLEV